MSVEFQFKNGRTKVMSARFADILAKMGKGEYATREMRAAKNLPGTRGEVDIDELDIDALRALADERGVKFHEKAGADKLRSLLRKVGE